MNNKTLNNFDECHADISITASDAVSTAKTCSTAEEFGRTVSCVNWDHTPEWSPWSGTAKCPKCGKHNIEVNNFLVLTSNPPQQQLRCKDCGYYFSSGMFNSRNTSEDSLDDYWKQDQSILNTPKVGDAPWAPQVGDWPPSNWPSDPEPPSYPDIYIPRKDSPSGWVCPKCGRCWAPHVSGCSHCNESSIKITY